MLILVTGGSASGKSAYAEDLAVRLHSGTGAGEMPGEPGRRGSLGASGLWYAATMYHDLSDEETVRRIEKHRRQRAGKGFETLEQPRGIGALKMRVRPGDTVLLEDLSNLLANELFFVGDEGSAKDPYSEKWDNETVFESFLRERIIGPVLKLHKSGVRVVAVGNRIAEETDTSWDRYTAAYVAGLQKIQTELGKAADQVVEVVCGIPVIAGSGDGSEGVMTE